MLSSNDRGMRSMSWILGSRNDHSNKKRELVTRDLLRGVTVHTSTMTQAEKINRKRSWSNQASHQLLDLNFPPAPDSAAVEPQLVPASASSSVCTLEMVKLALDREVRERQRKLQRSPSSSTTTSSLKRSAVVDEGQESSTTTNDGGGGEMLLAGCPHCLLYVMVAKTEPNCPRCNTQLPLPATWKKQRILID